MSGEASRVLWVCACHEWRSDPHEEICRHCGDPLVEFVHPDVVSFLRARMEWALEQDGLADPIRRHLRGALAQTRAFANPQPPSPESLTLEERMLGRATAYQCPGCWSTLTAPFIEGGYECDCGERLTRIDLRCSEAAFSKDQPDE